jgi:murein DD-endopeptidase MepM/ murein hydrolase activator NlpD
MMVMRVLAAISTFLVLGVPLASARATATGDADVAALQVALRAASAYSGPIDGQKGPETTNALIAFQQRVGLVPDGIAGRRTKRALGHLGRPNLGTRPLFVGTVGWDVAELQFRLAWHGFPSGPFDGVFGGRLAAAVRRFQRFVRLPPIGVAGPRTMAALEQPRPTSPLRLQAPVEAPIGDGFGPRGNAFHAGIDFVAPAGTAVGSARAGRVTWAGPRGSYGNAVVVAHGSGVRTLYAHLSRVDVAVSERVATGEQIGLVGSTGHSTGPHLHFEVRVRGASVDPLGALG